MARWLVIVFCFVGIYRTINCEDNKYDNYTLMKIAPQSYHQLAKLVKLKHDPEGIEILKRSRGLNRTTDVLVAPHKRRFLEQFVSKHGMPVQYKYNYGRHFESVPKSSLRSGFNVYGFNSYDDITSRIHMLAAKMPQLISIQFVGHSYEKRKMNLVKISTNPSGRNPIIFIDAGIHAREWVAPAMAVYIIHRLIKDPKALKRELNGVDWYILPVVNPDGYEFSRGKKSNRLWRKTRSKHTKKDCYGVDGNRNYGFEWGGKGTSKDPCDQEIYAGPKAFSENETQAVAKIMNAYKERIKLYVSIHSYGAYLVYPWGFTADILPENWIRMHNLARMVSDSVVRAGGPAFEVMSAGQWYPAAGGSDDYALAVMGIPYSYTMELTKNFEFTFPEELLETVLPQYYDGFITFSIQIKREFGSN
ncbi:carboxypeptidase B-like [Choristoneura fumiferana]|uniref:carboxypeptidase B-like n=1 Tax=Choristoneura fumiferana TaxID=7141 RepID=UPI003D158970